MFLIASRVPLGQCLLGLKRGFHSGNAVNTSSSLDADNMRVFSDLKNQWWDPKGPVMPLHAMNRMRIPFIREGLINTGSISKENQNTAHVLRGLNILDIGCGGGILTEALAKLQANVIGLEPSNELYEIASARVEDIKHLNLNLKYENRMVEDVAQEEANREHFDCVVLSEVIEHVNSAGTFLEECLKTLKPGGSLFITTFNKTAASRVLGIWVAEYILGLAPKNTHDWDKFIPLDEMHRMIESNNCSVLQTTGIVYTPWNNSWKTLKNTDVSYAIHAVKH